jgi:SAM-dependent methyltransferase
MCECQDSHWRVLLRGCSSRQNPPVGAGDAHESCSMRFIQLAIITALLICLAEGQSPLPEQIPINTPYVTTPPQIVGAMLELAGVSNGDTVYDLGCGDGRIVISAAKKYGARGVGIDLNPARIEEARANAQAAGVTERVSFEVNDLFDADIRSATVVAVYLLPEVNIRLRTRLLRELKPGTRVVSHSFDMGDWKPDKEKLMEGDHLYLWTIPKPRAGNKPIQFAIQQSGTRS